MRARRTRRLTALGAGDAGVVSYFRERIYATFTGLAIVVVVSADDNPDAEHATLALGFGVLGIVVAGLVADVVGHLVVHSTVPDRAETMVLLRVGAGGLGTVLIPAGVLGLAWAEVIDVGTALTIAALVYTGTLVVTGWLAVRRTRLRWWQRHLVLGGLFVLGLVTVGIQIVAKTA